MPDPAVGRADEKLLPAHGTTPHRWIMPQMWMWMDGCCRRGRPASRSMCVMQGNATVARGVVWCPAGSFVPLWPPVRPRLFPGRRAASALLFFCFVVQLQSQCRRTAAAHMSPRLLFMPSTLSTEARPHEDPFPLDRALFFIFIVFLPLL